MRRITGEERKHRDDITAKLNELEFELCTESQHLQDSTETDFTRMTELQERYNAAIVDANLFIQFIHEQQQMYFDSRSNRWAESDAGMAYADWMDAWDIELDALDCIDDAELSEPDFSSIQTFTDLPDRPA